MSVYSSQTGTWSETTSAAQDTLDLKCLTPLERSALAGNVLYIKFFTRLSSGILKYDLGMQEISWINLPSYCTACMIFTEYGGLGIARGESSRLHLWSGEAGPPDNWDGHQVESLSSIQCSLLMPTRFMWLPFCMALVPFCSIQTMGFSVLIWSLIGRGR